MEDENRDPSGASAAVAHFAWFFWRANEICLGLAMAAGAEGRGIGETLFVRRMSGVTCLGRS